MDIGNLLVLGVIAEQDKALDDFFQSTKGTFLPRQRNESVVMFFMSTCKMGLNFSHRGVN